MTFNRRRFFTTSTAAIASGSFLSSCEKSTPETPEESTVEAGPHYDISLAQWSNHRALKGGELDNLDWPAFTKENFGISAVEWVNQFFGEPHDTLGFQPKGGDYIAQMKQRCDDNGVTSVLIMCDRVGSLGNPDNTKRTAAIEGHYAWLDAAKELGCHSIRVNAASDPKLSPEKQADLCADGLRRLSQHAATLDLNVIVENHGGLSSNGAWLAGVLSSVGMTNCGSLPDYGNFYLVKNRGKPEQYAKQKALYEGDPSLKEDEYGLGYDRYRGVKDLMPFAKGVSAKAHDFDEQGNEIHTDFGKMMEIVVDSGYEGYIGVEYEGRELGEVEGIKKTKALLEKVIAAV
ncbi:MAG: sugar phosphate isomerase/epimerase [Verrucomicrobiales bacterium]|nr:sugar phosphate isomerase/epimerase [Verrucomicrobiales bacterium]